MSDHYTLFGYPIRHSRSPAIHAAFSRAAGHDMRYDLTEVADDGFEAGVAAFRAAGGAGANVTTPFKLRALALADTASAAARLAGAANCLTFGPAGVQADNFDGVGLVRDITVNLGVPIRGRRVLLLGAGGAARGAVLPFLAEEPAELVLANRHRERAAEIRAELQAHPNVTALALAEVSGGFDVVVNATSTSMTGARPDIPDQALVGAALAYDLAYARGVTPFLQQARQDGARLVADGVGMLVEQAAEAFALWRGIRPETAALVAEIAAETQAVRP